MVLVKITRIQSVKDPETGEDGKQIEFNEFRKTPMAVVTRSDEAKLVQEMVSQLRMTGFPFLPKSELKLPKMILFLTEEECEGLGIKLEVNRTYDLKFRDGKAELNLLEGF